MSGLIWGREEVSQNGAKGVGKEKFLDFRSQEVDISVSYSFFTMFFFSAISEYFGISLC